MSNLTFHTYPGLGEFAAEHLSYSQAVRVGETLHISGQGGWNPKASEIKFDPDLSNQIDQAFKNVQHALSSAGGKGWSEVFKVTSYHLNLNDETTVIMVRNFRKWMPEHKPLWTEIGVSKLGAEGMDVEIVVEAYSPVARAGTEAIAGASA